MLANLPSGVVTALKVGLGVVAVGAVGVGGYYAYQSTQKDDISDENDVQNENGETEETEVSGDASEIKILDGDVVEELEDGTSNVLVNKADHEGVTEFIEVNVSSDNSMMCFLARTLTPQWLYVAKTDGSGVTKVALANECVWSNGSDKIAFTNHTTDVSPRNVFVYDVNTLELKNLTESVNGEDPMRSYQTPTWSNDDTKITSKYQEFSQVANFVPVEGESEITLETGKIVDK